jgi:hypothetical protein
LNNEKLNKERMLRYILYSSKNTIILKKEQVRCLDMVLTGRWDGANKLKYRGRGVKVSHVGRNLAHTEAARGKTRSFKRGDSVKFEWVKGAEKGDKRSPAMNTARVL